MSTAYLHLDRLRVLKGIKSKLQQFQSVSETSIKDGAKVLAVIYTKHSEYPEEAAKLASLLPEYPELLEFSYIETLPMFELQGETV